MNPISSNQNSIIKELKSLKTKKYREEKKLYFIEGTRFVEEALKEKMNIAYILFSEKYLDSDDGKQISSIAHLMGYRLYLLPDKLFREISDTENPQGVMAVIKMKMFELEEILSEKCNFLIVLDSIQDPGNMGTIIRTADAAGASGIIMSKGCVDLYNPKVLRSTMGSIFHLPVCFSSDITEDILLLKSRGVKICAAHLKGEVDYYDVSEWDNTAIIIGNEANGICDEVASSADLLVKIPMAGRAESLNASVAAGLLIYEALRNRPKLP
ncbi:MAG: 23S rRNA (guanosine(2251)-2'-O)-methyltransferase RlmB [Clostridia bacterium]|nr:23S rRNA (guanosine(2251)-2'-O)-methyltransferase RlmB [Clostridia bacterium]